MGKQPQMLGTSCIQECPEKGLEAAEMGGQESREESPGERAQEERMDRRAEEGGDVEREDAKLPIGRYLSMSSSQVLAVNQVVEILLNYLETKDWKTSFFQVIPQPKRLQAADDSEEPQEQKVDERENCEEKDDDQSESKKQCANGNVTDA